VWKQIARDAIVTSGVVVKFFVPFGKESTINPYLITY
jgi:hypothetical protein